MRCDYTNWERGKVAYNLFLMGDHSMYVTVYVRITVSARKKSSILTYYHHEVRYGSFWVEIIAVWLTSCCKSEMQHPKKAVITHWLLAMRWHKLRLQDKTQCHHSPPVIKKCVMNLPSRNHHNSHTVGQDVRVRLLNSVTHCLYAMKAMWQLPPGWKNLVWLTSFNIWHEMQ